MSTQAESSSPLLDSALDNRNRKKLTFKIDNYTEQRTIILLKQER